MKTKKLLIINILNVLSIIIELIVCFVIAYFNFDWLFIFKESCIAVAAFGVINFAFILIREIMVLSYDSKKYSTIMCVAHTFFAVVLYYVAYFLNQNEVPFANYSLIVWISLLVILVLPFVIFPILNHFDAKNNKNDKPKFIVNK